MINNGQKTHAHCMCVQVWLPAKANAKSKTEQASVFISVNRVREPREHASCEIPHFLYLGFFGSFLYF